MPDTNVPESRTYRHVKCGTETTISGQPFEVMSNPLSDMAQTWCTGCNAMFTLDEYEWADSGGTVPAYYARHSVKATNFERFLCSRKNMLVMGGLGLILGGGGGYYLFRNSDMAVKIFMTIFCSGLGGFVGLAIYVSVICNLITRRVCGVSDTRTLV